MFWGYALPAKRVSNRTNKVSSIIKPRDDSGSMIKSFKSLNESKKEDKANRKTGQFEDEKESSQDSVVPIPEFLEG